MKYSIEYITGKEKYYEQFDMKNDSKNRKKDSNCNYEEALKSALDIRKFEIEMYWKRTTYFWAITAVAIAGYFSLLRDNNPLNTNFLTYLVSSIGLVFSLGWYLVNRGSKYWQRNWELHVDLLEDKVYGSLYKLNINPAKFKFWNLTDAYRISVSKINQLLSFFIVVFWCYLFIEETFKRFTINYEYIIIFAITLIFIFAFFLSARYKQQISTEVDFLLRKYE